MRSIHPKTIRERMRSIDAMASTLASQQPDFEERVRNSAFGEDPDSSRQTLVGELDRDKRVLEKMNEELESIGNMLEESSRWQDEASKQIFALSTGALALSVTFHSTLVPDVPIQIETLRYAWMGFAAAAISYPLSLLVRASAEGDFPPRTLWWGIYFLLSAFVAGGFLSGSVGLLRFALANYPVPG